MAKRARTRYRTRIKKVYSKRKGLLGGGMTNYLWSAGAGYASSMIPNNLPIVGKYAKPAVLFGAGWLLKKPALMHCGAYEAGKMISGGSVFKAGGAVNGFYE